MTEQGKQTWLWDVQMSFLDTTLVYNIFFFSDFIDNNKYRDQQEADHEFTLIYSEL